MADLQKMKSLSNQIESVKEVEEILQDLHDKFLGEIEVSMRGRMAAKLAKEILEERRHQMIGELNAMRVQMELEEQTAKEQPPLPIPSPDIPRDKHGNPLVTVPGKTIAFAKEGERMNKADDTF